MAALVSTQDIRLWPIQSYATIRPNLKSGDLLFCSGNYTVSKVLEKVTNSPWSHVGIVIWAFGRVLLFESVEDIGVRLSPLSTYVSNYANSGSPYDGVLVLTTSSATTSQQIPSIVQFGADQLALPYDNQEIAEIIARITLGIGRKTATSGYICSELVAACFAAAGIIIKSTMGGFVMPQDIWIDQSVALIARVH